MSQITQRPQTLWSQESPTPSVQEYFDTYQGEFDTKEIESDYPYGGRASWYFRQVLKMGAYEASIRFEGKGNGCWALRSDRILNNLTADVLAAAEALGGKLETTSASAMPGGIGADVGTIWVALLDGGVGVDVVLCQHETTNRMQAYQRTTIRGPRAYRALLKLLGCHWINRRLPGESATPSHEEFIQLVNDLLAQEAP
jgi:hypothetical protein